MCWACLLGFLRCLGAFCGANLRYAAWSGLRYEGIVHGVVLCWESWCIANPTYCGAKLKKKRGRKGGGRKGTLSVQ